MSRPLRVQVAVLTAMVLLGSLLSFGMEPLVGRLVVPFYGGSVHVWTTSMMTFQGLLLLGYAYAHLVAPRIGAAHLVVLLLPLLQLPLGFQSPVSPEAPIATLVVALLSSVALLFAALTTTAVVAQSWWAHSALAEHGEPWWLYGASNLGSLSALIGYPLLVEPFFGLHAQTRGWSWLYGLYVVLACVAWMVVRPSRADAEVPDSPPSYGWRAVGSWIVLSAAPSALLLSLTNQIAHEIGSFPLVWVVPLALYLGSFLVAFSDHERAVVRFSRSWVLIVAFQLLSFVAFRGQANLGVLALSLLSFALLCVSCHRLLFELRPDLRGLTAYYLWVALGGWIGGTVITLGAPTLLPGLYEPFLSCAAVALALGSSAPRAADPRWVPWKGDPKLRNRFAAYGAVLLLVALVDRSAIFHGHVLAWKRNFYGTYRIEDVDAADGTPAYRRMVHGGTLHGAELLEGEPGRPGSYYSPNGPLMQAIAARGDGPRRVAVIGLGAGAMAWKVDGDDRIVYYEIDRDTETLARRWFTFLGNSKAAVEVRPGDARLTLQQENARQSDAFDVLVVDAFSGDGIPLHLATREAWDIYAKRLATDGLLVFHVSNRYYDLRPILARFAQDTGLAGACANGRGAAGENGKGYEGFDTASEVVAFARDPERLKPLFALGWRPIADCVEKMPEREWTDDFASVLTALR